MAEFVDGAAAAVADADGSGRNTMSKRWCFTLQAGDGDAPTCSYPRLDGFAFYCGQLERGARGGNLHWQCYVRFSQKKRFSTMRRMIPGAHLELAHGSEQQCADYCCKDDTFVPPVSEHRFRFGEMQAAAGSQGHRSDLDEVASMVLAGVPVAEIARQHPKTFIRNCRGIRELKDAVAPPPPASRQVTCLVWWGPGGEGKTYRVEQLFQAGDVYSVTPGDPHPFDNYKGERILVLDEFESKHWKAQLLNMILDRRTFQLPCRYQNKYSLWDTVIILCNKNPVTWFEEEDPAVQMAVRRRIHQSCRYITQRAPLDPTCYENVPLFTDRGAIVTQVPTPGYVPVVAPVLAQAAQDAPILAPDSQPPSPSSSPSPKRMRSQSPVLAGLGSPTQLMEDPPARPSRKHAQANFIILSSDSE